MQYFNKLDLFTRIHTKGTVKHFSKLFDHLTFFETLAQRRWQVYSKRFSAGSLSRVNARSPLDNVTRPRKIRTDTEDHSMISIQLCFSWLRSHPKSLKEEMSAILILAKRWHVSFLSCSWQGSATFRTRSTLGQKSKQRTGTSDGLVAQ